MPDPLQTHRELFASLSSNFPVRRDPKVSTDTGLYITTFETVKPPIEVKKQLTALHYKTTDGKVYTHPDYTGHVVMCLPVGRESPFCNVQIRSQTASPR